MRKQIGENDKGEPIFGEEVPIVEMHEAWNTYKLEDGTELRLRSVAMGIFRLDGRYDPDGNPEYAVMSKNVVTVKSPAEIRRKVSDGH